MGKLRSKTLVEQLGFNDPDLKSPVHDAMVMWLSENVQAYLEVHLKGRWQESIATAQKEARDHWGRCLTGSRQELEGTQSSLEHARTRCEEFVKNPPAYAQGKEYYYLGHKRDIDRWAEEVQKLQDKIGDWEKVGEGQLLEEPAFPVINLEIVFERPVVTHTNYIVGFIDLYVAVEQPVAEFVTGRTDRSMEVRVRHEHAGYGFEVKPSIPSLGELLRQLRTYQTHDRALYTVVSPDTRWRDVIVAQGFGFLECPHIIAGCDLEP